MENKELKAIQEAISRQRTNNVPQIYIQDLQGGNVFEYGKNCHDRLVISEDGRSLHYENLQNGDGSKFGDYRFYYEKPKLETEMDKMHEIEIDHWARNIKNKSINKLQQENQALKDRWKKLKDILYKDIEHNQKEYDESFCTAFNHYSASENWVLDRMQELEQGESDAKD